MQAVLCFKAFDPDAGTHHFGQAIGIQCLYVKGALYPVARQPPCPRATTILAGFEATAVGVLFDVLG